MTVSIGNVTDFFATTGTGRVVFQLNRIFLLKSGSVPHSSFCPGTAEQSSLHLRRVRLYVSLDRAVGASRKDRRVVARFFCRSPKQVSGRLHSMCLRSAANPAPDRPRNLPHKYRCFLREIV